MGIHSALCLSRLSSSSSLSSLKSHLAARLEVPGLDLSRLSLSTDNTLSLCTKSLLRNIDKGPTTLCMRLAENDDNFESDRERGWSLESRGGVSAGRDREN